MRLSALIRDGGVHVVVQVIAVLRNEVGQVAVFGVVPHLFAGIEVRRIGRKPFHLWTVQRSQISTHRRRIARRTHLRKSTMWSERMFWRWLAQ